MISLVDPPKQPPLHKTGAGDWDTPAASPDSGRAGLIVPDVWDLRVLLTTTSKHNIGLTVPRVPHQMDVKNQSRANFRSWLNTSWNVNLVFSWVALKLSTSFVINFKSPPFLLCQCNTWSAAQCHFCIFLGLHYGSPQLSTHSKSPPSRIYLCMYIYMVCIYICIF